MEGRILVASDATEMRHRYNKLRLNIALSTRYGITSADRKNASVEKRRAANVVKIEAILSNPEWKDSRIESRRCNTCHKLCLRDESHKGPVADTHTLCSYSIYKVWKKVGWASSCLYCERLRTLERNQTKYGFDNSLMNGLRYHVNGTIRERRAVLASVRSRCKYYCSSCGIALISKSKAGFAQESLNAHSPELFTIDQRSATDIHLSQCCMACNFFQHKYSWKQHLQNLIELCDVPLIRNTSIADVPSMWVRIGSMRMACQMRWKLLQQKGDRHCAASGIEMRFESGFWNSVSIDRIDGKRGYVLDNCRLVCKCLNYVKNYSIDEAQLQAWIAHIRSIGPDVLRIFNDTALMHMPYDERPE